MNKEVAILGIWASITALIIVLVLRLGIEFLGIIILLGVAILMTFVILGYDSEKKVERRDEIDQIHASIKSLEEKIEDISKQLEK